MKLLFDQNISFRIVHELKEVFPDSRQVRDLGLENARDIDIWNHARIEEYCIVTFDADFIDLSNLKGHPPKILWLRMGNTNTISIAKRLIDQANAIRIFLENKDSAFLEIR